MLLPRGIKVVLYSVMCSAILMFIFFGEDITLCYDTVTLKVSQTQCFLLRTQYYLHAVAPCSQLIIPPSGATNTKYIKEGNIKKRLLTCIKKHNSF
jgi:hypothetical protein